MSAEQIDRSRLTEIDDRLRTIQEGLLQDAQSSTVPVPAPPVDARPERLIAELCELADRQQQLLHELRGLLGFADPSPHERS